MGTSIGISGHRSLTVDPALAVAIDSTFHRICWTFPAPLVLLSPLAEGADQIVAERGLALGHCRLIVPLPCSEADYLSSFETLEGKRQFTRLRSVADEVIVLTPASDDPVEHRYCAVGLWLVDHSDVLIVVWNGLTARRPGGTSAVVDAARSRALPVAWINAGDHKVTYERFPSEGRV